jgi:hypothetical protein
VKCAAIVEAPFWFDSKPIPVFPPVIITKEPAERDTNPIHPYQISLVACIIMRQFHRLLIEFGFSLSLKYQPSLPIKVM